MSVTELLCKRIEAMGKGSVFTPNDFWEFGSRAAIDQVLSRLARRGVVRRITRGVYDYPRINNRLGITVYPSVEKIASAIAKSFSSRIQPSGAYAANVLGLSTQVPARIVYLTDGYSRRIKLGEQEIIFRRASPKTMATAGHVSGTVIQALRYLGSNQVTPALISKLKHSLPKRAKAILKKDRQFAPEWMRQIMDELIASR